MKKIRKISKFLNFEDRKYIQQNLVVTSRKQIARNLSVSDACIYLEVARNGGVETYNAQIAENRSNQSKIKRRTNMIVQGENYKIRVKNLEVRLKSVEMKLEIVLDFIKDSK